MLKCPNCGEENALGKVFCANCGMKLDLAQINEDEIEEMGKTGRWLSYWPFFLLGLGAVLVALVGLALWPLEGTIGPRGSKSDAGLVRSQLSVIRRISKGRTVEPQFTAKQLNGYMINYPGKKLGLPVFCSDIQDDVLSVRMVRQFGPFGPAGNQFHLKLMMEADYKTDGSKLLPQSGALGHLPLPGPLSILPHKLMTSAVEDAEASKSVPNIKEIGIENGRLRIKASR